MKLRNLNSKSRRNAKRKAKKAAEARSAEIAKKLGATRVVDLGVGPDPLNPAGGIFGVKMLVTDKAKAPERTASSMPEKCDNCPHTLAFPDCGPCPL